jgi:DNA polymerase elongation subunit (family B)
LRLLSIDIETSPHIVYRWDLFDKSMTPNAMLIHPSRILCFAARWVGENSGTEFYSEHNPGRTGMLNELWRLLDEADVLLTYNGSRFDEPRINAELLQEGLNPPAPYQRIDLYKAVKRRFKFASGKLDYICQALELGQKVVHEGFELWTKCLADDADAWAKMEEYNVRDVVLNEDLYYEIRPWIPGLPSYGAETGEDVCPACGSSELVKQGHAFTKTGRYQRFVCRSCHTWSRSTHRDPRHTEIVQTAA